MKEIKASKEECFSKLFSGLPWNDNDDEVKFTIVQELPDGEEVYFVGGIQGSSSTLNGSPFGKMIVVTECSDSLKEELQSRISQNQSTCISVVFESVLFGK